MKHIAALVPALALLVLCGGVPALAGQQYSRGTVTRTQEGDHVFKWVDHDGKEHTLVVVPGDRVVPGVLASIRLGDDGQFIYEYTVSNAAAALQHLYTFRVLVRSPARIVGSPADWEPNELPRYGRVYWYRRSGGAPRTGIPPGALQGGFAIASPNLPGVTELHAAGATPTPSSDAELPQDMEARFNELQSAVRSVKTLGPTISVGDVASGLIKVRETYQPELLLTEHPATEKVLALLDRTAQSLQRSRLEEARRRLGDAIDVLSQPAGSAWRDQLSLGLGTALGALSRRLEAR